jgi:hypothetical protein
MALKSRLLDSTVVGEKQKGTYNFGMKASWKIKKTEVNNKMTLGKCSVKL